MAHPERLAGLHFFNPVDRMPLVEIIVGARTVARGRGHRAGARPPARQDAGRGQERARLPGEPDPDALPERGAAPVPPGRPHRDARPVDGRLRHADGPVRACWTRSGSTSPTRCRTSWAPRSATASIRRACSRRWSRAAGTGKKSGLGFYRYRGGEGTPDPAVYPLADRPSRDVITAGPDAWRERMTLAMINEAARCLEEASSSSRPRRSTSR